MSTCPQTSVPCVDSVVLDVERLGMGAAPGSRRVLLGDSSPPPATLDQLSPPPTEAPPRTPADVSTAVSSKASHLGEARGGTDRNLTCVCVLRPGPLLQELHVSSQHPV